MLKTFYGKEEIYVIEVEQESPDQEILFWQESDNRAR